MGREWTDWAGRGEERRKRRKRRKRNERKEKKRRGNQEPDGVKDEKVSKSKMRNDFFYY